MRISLTIDSLYGGGNAVPGPVQHKGIFVAGFGKARHGSARPGVARHGKDNL